MFAQLGDRPHAGVLVALVMGDQRAISAEQWALFNRTGISHLVSISGLHITMIAGLCAASVALLWRRSAWALQRATVPVAAGVAAVAAALGYCLIAGWGVPAQRTFLMIATMAAMTALRGRAAAALTLALAAAVVCALDPWAVIAAGFWLSFGAVAAIFLVLHGELGAGGSSGLRTTLFGALRVQAAVTIALTPLGIVLFQQLSLVAPLANAVAIPAVSYVVTPLALCGGAVALLPGAAGALAYPMLWAADSTFGVLAALLRILDALPGASVAVPTPPAALLAVSFCGVGWCLAPGIPARWVGLLWMAPLFTWTPPRPAAGELWVTALDVGQGMALVVESADAAVLFDTGPRYTAQADAGARVVLPFLHQRGLQRLDAVVVSHLDIDHSGGLRTVHRGIPTGRLLTSIPPSHPMLTGIDGVRCEAGQRWRHGSLVLEVLQPVAGDYLLNRSTNARSCVVRASVGQLRVLLTGDVPARQEAEMVLRDAQDPGGLRAALLVAPHHGSHSSSTDALIEAVAPRWVVIQVGYRSRFGHPHGEVLRRYLAHGVEVLRTDYLGAIQWRLAADGGAQVERWRIDHRRYWHNQPGGFAALSNQRESDMSVDAEPRDGPEPDQLAPFRPPDEGEPAFAPESGHGAGAFPLLMQP
jgi:competence protein ComEC